MHSERFGILPFLLLLCGAVHAGPNLYVGDTDLNNVHVYDTAGQGKYLGTVLAPDDALKITGIRTLLFHEGELLLINQNANLGRPGEVLRFSDSPKQRYFKQLQPLVASNNANAPWAPRCMVIRDGYLYVSDIGSNPGAEPIETPTIWTYEVRSGKLVSKLGATDKTLARFPSDRFHPQGLVFGPDGLLYVACRPLVSGNDLVGDVLAFSTKDGHLTFRKVVATTEKGTRADFLVEGMHRPYGVNFGRDRKLYVNVFKNLTNDKDTDKVIVLDVFDMKSTPEVFVVRAKDGRAAPQDAIFGPGNTFYLFIPNGPPNVAVRKYRVPLKAENGFIEFPNTNFPFWSGVFKQTNPATRMFGE